MIHQKTGLLKALFFLFFDVLLTYCMKVLIV